MPNVDQWFRAIAMSLLMDNNEYGLFTGDRRGDDYAMYRGVEDERFLMIPYDWDTLFRDANRGINQPRNVPALARLIDHPEISVCGTTVNSSISSTMLSTPMR